MFKIINNVILLTRGDKAVFDFSIDNYIFTRGDKVVFAVYDKKGLENPPLIKKEKIIEDDSKVIQFELNSLDTKIGKIVNKPTEYWYEIQLNEDQTVLGYDTNGPKLLILYPEGADINV